MRKTARIKRSNTSGSQKSKHARMRLYGGGGVTYVPKLRMNIVSDEYMETVFKPYKIKVSQTWQDNFQNVCKLLLAYIDVIDLFDKEAHSNLLSNNKDINKCTETYVLELVQNGEATVSKGCTYINSTGSNITHKLTDVTEFTKDQDKLDSLFGKGFVSVSNQADVKEENQILNPINHDMLNKLIFALKKSAGDPTTNHIQDVEGLADIFTNILLQKQIILQEGGSIPLVEVCNNGFLNYMKSNGADVISNVKIATSKLSSVSQIGSNIVKMHQSKSALS